MKKEMVLKMVHFSNRQDAGQQLAKKLLSYADKKDVIILALPRGGVPVAHEVAIVLHVPLDVLIVRKLGVPYNEELAMGALAMGGTILLDRELIESLGISRDMIEDVIHRETLELNRRNDLYRGGSEFPDVKGKIVLLIDDGIATGSTIKAALMALKKHKPNKIVVAVPVAPSSVYEDLYGMADEIVCLLTPDLFYAVGQAYMTFSQTTDGEVQKILGKFSNTKG